MPPPLGGAVPGLPKKPSVKPSVPLRSFFWSKIPDVKVTGTVWEKLDDARGAKVDVGRLEKMFQKKEAAVRAPGAGAGAGGAGKAAKPTVVTLVDGKRQQNVSIALARLRLKPAELARAVLRLDESALAGDRVGTLLNIAPTGEEISAVKEYEGDAEQLGGVEKFFLATTKVPRFQLRLKCWLAKQRFGDQAEEVEERLRAFETAIAQVKGNAKFHRVLETVLAIGNHMNGGTARGGAYGFKLETIGKLGTVKSADNKRTLLHFLAEQIDQDKELADWTDTMDQLSGALQAPLSQLEADFNNLSNGVKMVTAQVELQRNAPPTDPDDRFEAVMGPFAEDASKKVASMQKRLASVQSDFEEVVQGFGETPAKMDTEKLFSLLKSFVDEYGRARKDNARLAAQEAKERKAEAGEAAGAAAGSKEEGKDDNLVDSMYGRLRAGNVDSALERIRAREADSGAARARRRGGGRSSISAEGGRRGSGGGPQRMGLPGMGAMQSELAARLAARRK